VTTLLITYNSSWKNHTISPILLVHYYTIILLYIDKQQPDFLICLFCFNMIKGSNRRNMLYLILLCVCDPYEFLRHGCPSTITTVTNDSLAKSYVPNTNNCTYCSTLPVPYYSRGDIKFLESGIRVLLVTRKRTKVSHSNNLRNVY